MVQHTFSSGVNTNFSSELNDNFSEAETARSNITSTINSFSSNINSNTDDISGIVTDWTENLEFEDYPGNTIVTFNSTDSRTLNVEDIWQGFGQNSPLSSADFNWCFEIVYKYDVKVETDGSNNNVASLLLDVDMDRAGGNTTVINNLTMYKVTTDADTGSSDEFIQFEGTRSFTLHNFSNITTVDSFTFTFTSSYSNDAVPVFDIQRIIVWPMIGYQSPPVNSNLIIN